MAIQRITLVVCDKCGSKEGAESFTIKGNAGTARVDLCAEDRKPIEELIALTAPAAPRRGGRPKGSTNKTK